MTSLVSRLRLPEAVGLSLAVISPTVTAAFNITLVVQAVGEAAPLVFVIGMVAMALVALSFMAFTHRVAHAGSAYAYISHTFGSRAGFIAGWTLLLTYLGFATGFAALVGSFTLAALKGFGIDAGAWWIGIGAGATVLAWWLAYRDMRLAGRLMLLLEAIAIIAIVGLCLRILREVHPDPSRIGASFQPSAQFNGWVGVGFGMVFSILSFSGFEGAATLGEETLNPRRNIPIALLGTVLGSGVFFVFVAYCEVTGFGSGGLKALAASQAPLDDLALRYGSPRLAILLDLAAAISCFSGIIGALAAAGRILFALGRAGLSSTLADVHPVHRTPSAALSVAALLIFVPFVAWGPIVGSGNYYSYTSTIGVLALILIYVGVGAAEAVEAWREQRPGWAGVCVLGPILLLWVLYRNIYPVPEFPNNLWPYVAFVWASASWALMRWRPLVTAAALPDYS
ncbi:MAG TPA: APC family permease [Steroidobacteraceae bacterium]|nr:APC family permease [Steroidobacteraceae bacterium]